MIKASELRIGNLVYFGIVFEPIMLKMIDPESPIILMAEPIPLTGEWLLKFGEIEWLKKDELGFFAEFNGNKIYFKFVHSLQNFYSCVELREMQWKSI